MSHKIKITHMDYLYFTLLHLLQINIVSSDEHNLILHILKSYQFCYNLWIYAIFSPSDSRLTAIFMGKINFVWKICYIWSSNKILYALSR